jgi:hypothetical protein
MSTRGSLLLSAILAAALGGPGLAAETVVVQGVVTAQTGPDILFDDPDGGLVGLPFTIQYQVLDPTIEEPFTQSFDYPDSSSLSGGFGNGYSPVLASVTINGVTFDDSGLWTNGEALRQAAASGQSEVYYQAEDGNWGPGDVTVSTEVSSTTDPFVTDPDYQSTLVHAVTGDDLAVGELSESYPTEADPLALQMATITLTPSSIAIYGANLGGGGHDALLLGGVEIPEPANWIMIVTGVAAVGGLLRRRRSGPTTLKFD